MPELYQTPCYCTNARRGAGVLTALYDAALADSGLTVAQYYLLVNLDRMERANITAWAKRIGLDRSTMVRNVRPLQARDLIVEVEGSGKTFALTAHGKATLEKARCEWEVVQERLREYLGADDAAELTRLLRKVQMIDADALLKDGE